MYYPVFNKGVCICFLFSIADGATVAMTTPMTIVVSLPTVLQRANATVTVAVAAGPWARAVLSAPWARRDAPAFRANAVR